MASCDKKNDDLVTPLSASAFPQVLVLDDEGHGDLEDEDKFSFKITLADRTDPEGKEPGGKIVPLKKDVTVQFAVVGFEGMQRLQDYILDAEAFYEIDDCTTSKDKGVDLKLQFNSTTGIGSVTFPAGIEEIEIEFETESSLFDDKIVNTDERSLTIQLTGITGADASVTVNKSAGFVYNVQDDEGIYGEWELDVDDAAAFKNFKALFGLVNEDIKKLNAADVDEITLAVEYGEVKATVVLKETEVIDDCGSPSVENKVIEIEAEIEDLDEDKLKGNIEFGETLELDNGSFSEFAYSGSFEITGKQMRITLKGELGDDDTEKITLELEK
jgi:hypothetical protein